MKSLRRSFKTDKERESRHTPSNSLQSRSATAIVPPKKVIKALYDYKPTNKNGEELAFNKGDFFHVIGREDDTEWYEACNPLIPSAKGLVPVAFFEVIGKQQRQSGQSVRTSDGHDSGFSEKGLTAGLAEKPDPPSGPVKMHTRGPSAARAGAMVYGIVSFDFQAERPDELEARAGESIIVVAQSNPEWFVAKPIGRLGGPGLIPVSFVQIKDLTTGETVKDSLAAVRAAGVPRVEEWKRTAAEYKNSSISLGQINTPQIGGANNTAQTANRSSPQRRQPQPQMQQIKPLPPAGLTSSAKLQSPVRASVPRYCFDNDMYWYIIECQMEDGRCWELSRYYADFYDLQIALIEKFPEEAGNAGKPRTLPYMPGPVAHVTDAISNGRRENLDDYIEKIVAMPDHIRCDPLVQKLFAPKPTDYEIDPSALNDEYRLSGHSLAQTASQQSSGTGSVPPLPTTRNGHQTKSSLGYQTSSANTSGLVSSYNQSQDTTLTQESSEAEPSTVGDRGPPAPGGEIRAKIEFNNDIRTIRIPQNIELKDLHEKVRERLGVKKGVNLRMKYRDDQRGTVVALAKESDLDEAIRTNANLRLVVDYAN